MVAVLLLIAGSCVLPVKARSQSVPGIAVHNLVYEKKLERQVGVLSSEFCDGRGTGSKGCSEAAFWIARQFRHFALMPIDSSYCSHFYIGKGRIGHNIVGMLPGSGKKPRNSYVIIGAHYDHIGRVGGKFYPGADSNASGVTAMLSLIEMFRHARLFNAFESNLLFVAFDAKELSMAGSEALWMMISTGQLTNPQTGETITPESIRFMVNIDQIGSTLSPLKSGRKDYLIMLGNETFREGHRGWPSEVNSVYDTDLELAYDYYGSSRFTDMFYRRMSDQKVFVQAGKPAAFFTSGITMKTNKTEDDAQSLDYGVLRRRIIFIYHWIEKFL